MRTPWQRLSNVSPLWVAALLTAAAFFGMEHFPAASTTDDYAPSQESMEGANTTADPGRRVALLAMLALTVYGLCWGRAASFGPGGLAGWTPVVWMAWLSLSMFWSSDPRTTVRRLIVLALFHGAALAVCRLLKARQVVTFAALCVALQLAVGILAELLYGTFRPWAGDYRFAGTIHPNMQALQLSAACVASASLATYGATWGRRTRWAALAAILTAFLLLTKSRTATGGAALAVAGVLLLSVPPRWKRNLLIPVVLVSSLAAMALLFGGFDPSDELHDAAMMGRNEQATSLSGRVPIWEALDPYVRERWWTGWGYNAFWSKQHIDALTDAVDFKFSGAHSSWYEAALDGGIVGATLFAMTLAFGLLRSGREFLAQRRALPAFVFGILICGCVNSVLEHLVCDTRLFPFLMYCGLWKLTFLRDAPGVDDVPTAEPVNPAPVNPAPVNPASADPGGARL
ncbi:hypothetical protein LzC2_06100 [Planctomycetes bacterium LzC2]|uniref:O-antigen ligase-related domain-containing protein n=1 Tax=Alienimonas chondri TaxID=2681879 RepID=A0ABX1V8W0_9PLAN|nr:hypothetical protein [Alienimonas chondri]